MSRRERVALHRRGSNQYQLKRKWYHSTYWNLLILPVVLLIGLPIRHYGLQGLAWANEATTVKSQVGQPMLSPLPDTSKMDRVEEVSPTPALTQEQDSKVRESGSEGLERYIRQVFGEDGDVAVAVSRQECNPANPAYPGCVNHSWLEHSCGMMQINIRDQRNGRAIHADKIPGETDDEKCAWLNDPFNNIRLAKKIYDDWGHSFQPWSAYTSGAYLKEL